MIDTKFIKQSENQLIKDLSALKISINSVSTKREEILNNVLEDVSELFHQVHELLDTVEVFKRSFK